MNPKTKITPETVRNTLKEMYPNAGRITLVEHGYDNIVGLVDERMLYVFREMPKHYRRSQYKKSVLQSISQHKN